MCFILCSFRWTQLIIEKSLFQSNTLLYLDLTLLYVTLTIECFFDFFIAHCVYQCHWIVFILKRILWTNSVKQQWQTMFVSFAFFSSFIVMYCWNKTTTFYTINSIATWKVISFKLTLNTHQTQTLDCNAQLNGKLELVVCYRLKSKQNKLNNWIVYEWWLS